jgi:hypothetical protein
MLRASNRNNREITSTKYTPGRSYGLNNFHRYRWKLLRSDGYISDFCELIDRRILRRSLDSCGVIRGESGIIT